MVNVLKNDGWILRERPDDCSYYDYLKTVKSLGDHEFIIDMHIKTLLVFPQYTQFYDHEAYKSGRLVLQDKASCLPVQILNPKPGSIVLDMCAAPGNKTSQVAAAIKNEGIIYAVEQDWKRYQILRTAIKKHGITCVKTFNSDVLKINDQQCPDVEYILVDPSCSGSGIVDRIDSGDLEKTSDTSRLTQLSGFQIMVLKHALRSFPKARRIVYSTCSLHPEENEAVVKDVLRSCSRYKLIEAKSLLNGPWHNVGSSSFGEIGKFCLYAKPKEDLTNGFFIAVFERLKPEEINPYRVPPTVPIKFSRKPDYNNENNKKSDNVHFNQENKALNKKRRQPEYGKNVILEEQTEDIDNISYKKKMRIMEKSPTLENLCAAESPITLCEKFNPKETVKNKNIIVDDMTSVIAGIYKKKKKSKESSKDLEKDRKYDLQDFNSDPTAKEKFVHKINKSKSYKFSQKEKVKCPNENPSLTVQSDVKDTLTNVNENYNELEIDGLVQCKKKSKSCLNKANVNILSLKYNKRNLTSVYPDKTKMAEVQATPNKNKKFKQCLSEASTNRKKLFENLSPPSNLFNFNKQRNSKMNSQFLVNRSVEDIRKTLINEKIQAIGVNKSERRQNVHTVKVEPIKSEFSDITVDNTTRVIHNAQNKQQKKLFKVSTADLNFFNDKSSKITKNDASTTLLQVEHEGSNNKNKSKDVNCASESYNQFLIKISKSGKSNPSAPSIKNKNEIVLSPKLKRPKTFNETSKKSNSSKAQTENLIEELLKKSKTEMEPKNNPSLLHHRKTKRSKSVKNDKKSLISHLLNMSQQLMEIGENGKVNKPNAKVNSCKIEKSNAKKQKKVDITDGSQSDELYNELYNTVFCDLLSNL